MSTTYCGMYRPGVSVKPLHVLVASLGGHSNPMSIEECESRGVLPDWDELSTERLYKALWTVHKIEKGASAFINPADAEECEGRDWLVPFGTNGWQLTNAGVS